MTRGKIIYISDDSQVFATCEFNGDMHPHRYGEDVLEGFKADYSKTIGDMKGLLESLIESILDMTRS